ncbi:MAG: hypothetical protein K2Y27_30385 [Xanthobacteraceae bacterium]|nr:hypothetical protein [Xanthobacteraceae bacterium]
MKKIQFAGRSFGSAPTTSRSWLSISVSHRVFAVLLLLFIAAVPITSTTGGTQLNSGGANLMLAPGQPGLEPTLY